MAEQAPSRPLSEFPLAFTVPLPAGKAQELLQGPQPELPRHSQC